MAGTGGKGAAKGGSTGKASNAALQDDEDLMARRRALFNKWKGTQKAKKSVHPAHLIDYVNSPAPAKRG